MKINIKEITMKDFKDLLSDEAFGPEAKEIIYNYYKEELKDTEMILETDNIEDFWKEYKTFEEFIKEEMFETDQTDFTEELIEEIDGLDIMVWKTDSENSLLLFYC